MTDEQELPAEVQKFASTCGDAEIALIIKTALRSEGSNISALMRERLKLAAEDNDANLHPNGWGSDGSLWAGV